jgi:hypothetical protein
MTKKETVKHKEFSESFKNDNIVIDKLKIIEVIVGVIIIFAAMFGIFYLAGIFK